MKKTLFSLCLLIMPASVPYAMDIQVLGLFKDMAIINVDGQRHKLRTGESTDNGIKLISADSEQAVLEINKKRETYKLGSRISTSFEQAKRETVETRIFQNNGMYPVTGSINNFPVSFLVDTGATFVSMNEAHARRIGIDFRYVGNPTRVSTANGVTRAYVVKLAKVKVGDIEIKNIKGLVHEGNSPSIVLLGNSFLNRVEMQRDGRVMVLRKKL